MKKSPGRKERRRLARSNRRAEGRARARENEKKQRQEARQRDRSRRALNKELIQNTEKKENTK